MRLHPGDALALVRAIVAGGSQHVKFGAHARQRMVERDIPDKIVFDVLRSGYVKGGCEAGSGPNEWKLKLCKAVKGRREVGVITLIVRRTDLLIKTVEWEDL